MKKRVFGRKLKRDKNERKALFKNLLSELVLHGRIKTTEQKAKAIRSSAEKLIAKAGKEVNLARKLLSVELIPQAMEKVIKEIAPKFSGRNGGYTRMVKLGRRFNDDASMVVMEWVEYNQGAEESKPAEKKAGKAGKTEIVEAEIVTEKPKAKAKAEKKEVKPKKTTKKAK